MGFAKVVNHGNAVDYFKPFGAACLMFDAGCSALVAHFYNVMPERYLAGIAAKFIEVVCNFLVGGWSVFHVASFRRTSLSCKHHRPDGPIGQVTK